MEFILGILLSLITFLPGSAIAAVIGALFIQFGTNKILGFTPYYGRSWFISFCHQIIMVILSLIFGFIILVTASDKNLVAAIAVNSLFVISLFFLQSAITYNLLKYEYMTYKDSLKIMGIVYGLILIIVAALGIPWLTIMYMEI